MRLVNPAALATIVARQEPRPRRRLRLRERVNAHTLWAFNPQPELTSRYDRAA